MIVVKVELHNANTGRVSEIGRMHISNDGSSQTPRRGNYRVELMRRGTKSRVQRRAAVEGYARLSRPVWDLVRQALSSLERRR